MNMPHTLSTLSPYSLPSHPDSFLRYVDLYAKDEEKFFTDFAFAFSKLLELGCDNLAPAPAP